MRRWSTTRGTAAGGATARAGQDPALPAWLQFIVPTDRDAPAGGGFAGILAEELGVLQHRLTEATHNVTNILDWCHSARMFRSPGVVPRALTDRDLPWDKVTPAGTRFRPPGWSPRPMPTLTRRS
jgi:hypothetical protein